MNDLKQAAVSAQDPYATRDSVRSRRAYTLECAFEYFITLLVAEPFLTKLLLYIGLDDATIGIVQSLISFAFLFQLASIFVVQRITNVKRVAATVHGIGQFLFMCLYLVPFMPFAAEYRTIIVFACFLLGYFGNYLVTSIIFRWGNSYVDPDKRARFAATKEMISLLSGVVFTFVMSWVLNRFENADRMQAGFLFVAGVMAVVCAADFICLMLIKNRINEPPRKADIVPLSRVVKTLFSNRGFVCVIILTILWQSANYMAVGFMGTYKQGELGLDVFTIQLINIAGNFCRFAFSRPIGRYTDRHSYAKGLALGLSIVAAAYLLNVFTSPRLWYMVIAYTVIQSIGMAGINQNLLNIVYNFVDDRYFVQASAIKNSIGGVCGFVAALIGSKILTAVQEADPVLDGVKIFGAEIYGQQLLSAISLVLAVIAIIFTHTVLEKQKIIAK